jgi:hypothetical protein
MKMTPEEDANLQNYIQLGNKLVKDVGKIMNEMTNEEKKVYNELLEQIYKKIDTNSLSYHIARLRDFVEVVNLRIEGANYKNEYDC